MDQSSHFTLRYRRNGLDLLHLIWFQYICCCMFAQTVWWTHKHEQTFFKLIDVINLSHNCISSAQLLMNTCEGQWLCLGAWTLCPIVWTICTRYMLFTHTSINRSLCLFLSASVWAWVCALEGVSLVLNISSDELTRMFWLSDGPLGMVLVTWPCEFLCVCWKTYLFIYVYL